MCNVSDGIIKHAYEKAYEKAKKDAKEEVERAKKEAKEEVERANLREYEAENITIICIKFMINKGFSIDEISNKLNIYGEKLEKIKTMI